MNVPDEVAGAIQFARTSTHPVTTSIQIEEQFPGVLVKRHWDRLQRKLKCPLPGLEYDQGHWLLPEGLATIWDLCRLVGSHHPDWELPPDETSNKWRNAQIFAGVRDVLVEVGCLRPNLIHRSSRLQQDLGLA
jgi:hypothetical protein